MLHISIRDKVSSYASIREQAGVTDIIHKIKQAKWRWAGHVARRNDNRWTIRLTPEGQPREGKRRRGRPKRKTEREDITAYVGSTWARLALGCWERLHSRHAIGFLSRTRAFA